LLIEGAVADVGTGTYTFAVLPTTTAPVALTLGSLVDASIDVPGELDRYSFSLANTTRVYFDALINDNRLTWTLAGPSGVVINARNSTSSSGSRPSTAVQVLPAGDYTLTIDASGDTTSSYRFRLSDLAGAMLLSPGTPAAADLQPAATDLYRFSAGAGDR